VVLCLSLDTRHSPAIGAITHDPHGHGSGLVVPKKPANHNGGTFEDNLSGEDPTG